MPPTTELATPAAANSTTATARASVVSPARLREGAEKGEEAFFADAGAAGNEGNDGRARGLTVKVLGAALGTAALLGTALGTTAVAVAAVAFAALAASSPLGAGAGAAIVARAVETAPCDEATAALEGLLNATLVDEVALVAGFLAAAGLDAEGFLAAAAAGFLAAAAGLEAPLDLITAGAFPAALAAAVSEIGDLVLTTLTDLPPFLAIKSSRSSPCPVWTGAREEAARAGVASPRSRAAARVDATIDEAMLWAVVGVRGGGRR